MLSNICHNTFISYSIIKICFYFIKYFILNLLNFVKLIINNKKPTRNLLINSLFWNTNNLFKIYENFFLCIYTRECEHKIKFLNHNYQLYYKKLIDFNIIPQRFLSLDIRLNKKSVKNLPRQNLKFSKHSEYKNLDEIRPKKKFNLLKSQNNEIRPRKNFNKLKDSSYEIRPQKKYNKLKDYQNTNEIRPQKNFKKFRPKSNHSFLIFNDINFIFIYLP